jgi:NAD(P)-dependent dehydrogenase (short-subunit alcohol dehydrogenase family)
MRLRGKNVVVAGAGPGLGSAVARRALEEGAQVYAVARRRKHLEPLAALGIRTGVFDLSKPEGAAAAALVETLAAELLERGIRVNGVAPGAMSREAETAKLGRPPRRRNTSPTW